MIEGKDGSIFISDDFTGAIYRVSFDASGNSNSGLLTTTQRSKVDPLQHLDPTQRELLAIQGASLYRDYKCQSCHASIQQKDLGGRYTLAALESIFDTCTWRKRPVLVIIFCG